MHARTIRMATLLTAAGITAMAGLSACGILTAPISVPAAVAENTTFYIKGPIVDQNGKPLDAVVIQLKNTHHFWAPLSGSKDVYDELTRRVDGAYDFSVRGSDMELSFSKDGYYPVTLRMNADNPGKVQLQRSQWVAGESFPVVMLSQKPADAVLAKFNNSISYAEYPVADCISLINLATDGRQGEIVFKGKDATDATIFPPGTLYLMLDKQPPVALNAKGDIDPAELDVPHHVTLRIPGNQSGFIRIAPRPGYEPMATSDTAPETGYVHDLTFDRTRLKEMRQQPDNDLIGSREFFFIRAGNYYGKGEFSWGNHAGKPMFRYTLYMQKYPDTRDLTMHRPGSERS